MTNVPTNIRVPQESPSIVTDFDAPVKNAEMARRKAVTANPPLAGRSPTWSPRTNPENATGQESLRVRSENQDLFIRTDPQLRPHLTRLLVVTAPSQDALELGDQGRLDGRDKEGDCVRNAVI